MRRNLFLVLMAVCGAVLTANVHAEPLRVPSQGNPALAVDMPAGWTKAADNHGNVDITSANGHTQVRLTMIADERVATTPLAEVAANILKGAKFPPYSSVQPASIDGRAAEAFLSTAVNQRGATLSIRILLAKLDPMHVAVVVRMAAANTPAAETSALDALVSRVRLVGAR